MRRIILILLLVVSSGYLIQGQKSRETPPPVKERIFYGGNFGLQFGTITDIQISPVIGFWILPRVAVAAGPSYRFFSFRSDNTHIYGGKTYIELVVLRNINSVIPIGANTSIILHLEDEALSLESSFWKDPPYNSSRFYLNTVLAGGGLSQQIGRRASMNLLALWALNESPYGIYSNPVIRIIFSF